MKNVYILTGAKCDYEVFSTYDLALAFAKKLSNCCANGARIMLQKSGRVYAEQVYCAKLPTSDIIRIIERPII